MCVESGSQAPHTGLRIRKSFLLDLPSRTSLDEAKIQQASWRWCIIIRAAPEGTDQWHVDVDWPAPEHVPTLPPPLLHSQYTYADSTEASCIWNWEEGQITTQSHEDSEALRLRSRGSMQISSAWTQNLKPEESPPITSQPSQCSTIGARILLMFSLYH